MVPRDYLALYLAANAFALGTLALAFWRRDVARWVVVAVFGWAAVTNAMTALEQPELYLDYATLTPSAWYRDFINGWFSQHIQATVIAIAIGQAIIAAVLSSSRSSLRWVGAAGAWIFLAAIAPLGVGSGFPFSLTFGAALLVSLEDVVVRSPAVRQAVHWLPRVLGFVIGGFMILLALDAFVEGQTTLDTMRGFGMHLVPAVIVLAILSIAWRWEWAGGVLFFALAIGYGFLADGRVSWMLAISMPLVIEGVLFLWSARLDRAAARWPGHFEWWGLDNGGS
jgi:uncharacterized membrane protein YwaF